LPREIRTGERPPAARALSWPAPTWAVAWLALSILNGMISLCVVDSGWRPF
jgi:hypothetical protein